MFDSISYLQDLGVNFWTEGKNVSEGWVNIQCIFPECDDRSNHLGINLRTGKFSCWKCGNNGYVPKLISMLEQCSYTKAKQKMSKYGGNSIIPLSGKNKVRALKVEMPFEIKDKFPKAHRLYLKNRNYNFKRLNQLYGVKACGPVGKFKLRIIIPVFMYGKLVTFVARDITGNAPIKYKNLNERLSVLPAKECIYGLDEMDRRGIIVEGPTDKWRMGFGTGAMFGLVFTKTQINLIKRHLDEVFIMFDGEPQAKQKAHELSDLLNMAGLKYTEVIEINEGDPDSLPDSEIKYIKKFVFGKEI